MKTINFIKYKAERTKQRNQTFSSRTGTHSRSEKAGKVIPFHAMLKNELKLYRGTSKSVRLGVLRKYDELITMAYKNRT